MTHFIDNGVTEIKTAADVAKCNNSKLVKYHFQMIAKDGIFFLPGKLGAISNAHTKSDINQMIKASEEI
jgi:glutamate-1-semialdehyde 2,1-aminomutase